jgi:hypothetical protein
MNTHTHTPGPWSVSNGLPTVWANNGERQIADCDKGPLRSAGEDLANARLIASAPELLAALIEMLDASERPVNERWLLNVRSHARAAIAKAEGVK